MNSPNKDLKLPSEVLEAHQYMEAIPKYFKHWEPHFEPLVGFPSKLEPSTSVLPKLELKLLPCYLKYVYLGEKEMLPTIIASYLSKEEKEKLLRVLKGISHLKCMYRILLEEGSRPIRELHTRLNLYLKEIMRAKVLKLLHVGVIYPISDSKWVSPVQVVPKMSRITVVKNENDELILQRTITG